MPAFVSQFRRNTFAVFINEHNVPAMSLLNEKVISDEPILMNEFRNGKNAAFRQVFRKYHEAVCNYASGIVADRESAKDIVSDVFIALWLNCLTINGESGIRSFLFTSAKNACLNHLRHNAIVRKHRAAVRGNLSAEQWRDPVTDNIFHVEDLHQVNSTIDKMPKQSGRVLKLTLKGLNTGDIAALMDLSSQHVRNTRVLATARLKNQLLQES